MMNKYSEGYPDARYYGGCSVIDDVAGMVLGGNKKKSGLGGLLGGLFGKK